MKTRIALVRITLALICFALVQNTQAVNPPPDGGYPGANTAEGTDALFSLTSGIANTAVGLNALHDNTTGGWNVAIGSSALASNTTGNFNMAIGTDALTNSTSSFNVAIGFRVGFMNTTGNHLTGIGAGALRNNTTGTFNTAIGADAMGVNTIGHDNTAIGIDALRGNTTGHDNTAVGEAALFTNSTGSFNTATGGGALDFNTTGTFNTATGNTALLLNTTGHENTASGSQALYSNRSGNRNTATGVSALLFNNSGSQNTAVGEGALVSSTGDNNTALGDGAGNAVTTASNVTCIGANVLGANVSNSCYIGNISGADAIGGDPVFITSEGKLGTVNPPSAARFKEEIKPMNESSEVILALKPVTFRYKKEFDSKRIPQFGLLAEEVEKANPDLVKRDRDGKLQTVRYDAVNAMLLNEFLKEHQKVQELEANDAEQQREIKALVATVKEQAAQIQKVSARLDASKPAPQMVLNDH